MPSQDTTQLKEKIMQTLRRRGPSLPVHIANETGLSILFASAFLSELISDRKIKISNLRVGSSPIYFIPGQEPQLEKYSHHLKSREKDAYMLLKEKRFLEDSKQHPAIRVALREIKDFAIGFQKNNKIFWRFFKIPESEFQEENKVEEKEKTQTQIPNSMINEIKQNIEEQKETEIKTESQKEISKEDELNIFDKEKTSHEKQEKEKKKPVKKKLAKKKTEAKKNEQFFIKVKEFLNNKSIEILDIESFNKNDLVLRIKQDNKEKLLIAFNKKRIAEADIIKAAKKANEMNLQYVILSLGGPLKKIENLIDAVRDLSSIEKL
ncbi:MAG: hypothetical protein PVJ67_04795 [Candidatus Pacearchaeota archaeon]|jgi:hypothetical protein